MFLVYIIYILTLLIAVPTISRSCKIFGTWINYYTLTNLWWLILTLGQLSLDIYDRPISIDVYMIFLLGLNFFNMTILFIKNKKKYNPQNVVLDLKYRRIAELFVFIFYLPQTIFNYKLIASGVELWEINYMYWSELRSSGNYLYDFIAQSVASPISFLLVATTLFKSYKKYSIIDFCITLLFSVLITIEMIIITGGGRTEMIFLVFALIISYLMSCTAYGKNYLVRVNKYLVVSLVVGGIVLISWATLGRTSSDDDFSKLAITGFSVYPPLFEYYLNNTRYFDNNTFGLTFFEPFILIIQYPFKHLFDWEFYPERINSITQQFVYISALGKELNAQVSAYWVYFRDFGWWGIILGPALTSLLLNAIYDFCKKNTFYICAFTYVLVLSFSSEFIFDGTFFYVLIFMILLKKISVVK